MAGRVVNSGTPVADVTIAQAGDQVAILATEASSSNVSGGVVAASADRGRGWSVSRVDVGGQIASAGGSFWISGGLMGDAVLISKDGQNWPEIKLPVDAKYWSVAPPVEVDETGVVVAVTTHDPNGDSRVILLGSGDLGQTWRALQTIDAPPTEFDTTVPTSILADGSWVAVFADGSKVITGKLGKTATDAVSPKGLATNVSDIAFASPANGVAVGATDDCPNGKSSCSSTAVIQATSDGGQTWHAIP
jgi:hypothetical protein